MKKIVIKFEENVKLHIGNELNEYISSDKLYSMIINSIALTQNNDDLESIISLLNNDTLISSAYLGIKISNKEISNKIEFLPRPFLSIINKSKNYNNDEELQNRKKFKKISWISRGVYDKLSRKYNKKEETIEYSFEVDNVFGGKYYIEDELQDEFKRALYMYNPFKEECIQRNSIDRYSKQSQNTYYENYKVLISEEIDGITFEPYFYFYIKAKENFDYECLKNLKYISLGGKASLGAGIVRGIYIEDVKDFNEVNADVYITLSAVFPNINEVKHMLRYSLEERNGFVFSKYSRGIRKPRIRIIREGSVFTKRVNGDIYEWNNNGLEHSIYVYGKAFLVPFGGVPDDV